MLIRLRENPDYAAALVPGRRDRGAALSTLVIRGDVPHLLPSLRLRVGDGASTSAPSAAAATGQTCPPRAEVGIAIDLVKFPARERYGGGRRGRTPRRRVPQPLDPRPRATRHVSDGVARALRRRPPRGAGGRPPDDRGPRSTSSASTTTRGTSCWPPRPAETRYRPPRTASYGDGLGGLSERPLRPPRAPPGRVHGSSRLRYGERGRPGQARGGTGRDTLRRRYIQDHLAAVARAIEDGGTCADTSSGHCCTTSSGRLGTRVASASCMSTSRRSSACRRRATTGTGTSSPRIARRRS